MSTKVNGDSHFIICVELTDGLYLHFVVESKYNHLFINKLMDIRIHNLYKVPCILKRLEDEEIFEENIQSVKDWSIHNL